MALTLIARKPNSHVLGDDMPLSVFVLSSAAKFMNWTSSFI
jgi:hypothetical protein